MPNSLSATQTVQKSPLDFIADEFWQDYVQGRPIDGGVSFESELRQCRLDGSLASLHRVDAFLQFVQGRNSQSPILLMQDNRSRNLVLFVGFYVGRVVAKIWRSQGTWLGQNELNQNYPQLKINPKNPFHFMALKYDAQQQQIVGQAEQLFFVLEPIAKQIFGQKLTMPAVQGGVIAPSVFEAVIRQLPEQVQASARAKAQPQLDELVQNPLFASSAKVLENQTTTPQATADADTYQAPAQSTSSTLTAESDNTRLSQALPSQSPQSVTQSTVQESITHQSIAQKRSEQYLSITSVRNDPFKELRAELNDIQVTGIKIDGMDGASSHGNDDIMAMFARANKVLNQLDKTMVARMADGIPIEQVSLSDQEKEFRKRALTVMQKAMSAGSIPAMLRLSIHFALGEGVEKNPPKGFELVQAAAQKGDAVAQRQLSRLYYQGIGCEQNMDKGREWLEKAAANGHQEAQELIRSWELAQAVIAEKKQDATTDKRYLMIIAAAAFIGLITLIFLPTD